MKPHKPVSMIILDVILTLWWIIFIVMFFGALIMTEVYKPDGLKGFRGEGMVVIFNFLISEGEGWLRCEWKVGRFWTSFLLLFLTIFTILLTHLYFDYFNYIDQYRWQHWLEPWRNYYTCYKNDSDV